MSKTYKGWNEKHGTNNNNREKQNNKGEGTMKTTKSRIAVPLMVLFVMIAAQGICLADTWHSSTIRGKVVSVDQAAREITLKDGMSNTITFAVDPKVDQFEAIAVGDRVTGHYCVAYTTEFRRPTAQEKETPFVALGERDAAFEDATPGTRVKVYRDVMSVKAVDTNVGMICLKHSKGNDLTVFNGNLLDKAKVYKTVIATYTEPLLVSIEN